MASLLTQIKVRKDTYANIQNLVLAQGEPGFAYDTGDYAIGDGSKKFKDICFKLQDGVINNGTSTNNAIARFDGATGRIIKNSGVTIDDSGNMVLPTNAHIKLNTYGTRFLTLTGNSITADMSAVSGGWAGAFADVKAPDGKTTTMLGWYGGTSLTHIFMGGTHSDPAMKMTAAGLFTFKNQVTLNAAQGTAPLAVTSTTRVANLNADLLDGKHASEFQPAGDYLTEESDTLQTVTNRGATTTKSITVNTLSISNTTATGHINFARGGWNYIKAPNAGSIIAFITESSDTVAANATLAIDSASIFPGWTDGVKNIGASSYQWNNIYMKGNIIKDTYTLTLPSKTGTVALLSDLTGGTITSVVAGDGLTGGGTSGEVTLNVGAGTGISVTADAVALATYGTAGTYGPTANATLAHKGTFTVPKVVTDNYGRVTAANITYTLPEDKDTLNTAGSTNDEAKLYLIGAKSQVASVQTYSDTEVYTEGGELNATSVCIAEIAQMKYDTTNECLRFVFA